MKNPTFPPQRREFLKAVATFGAIACSQSLLPATEVAAATPPSSPTEFCAFEKFLQDLSHEQLADSLAALGFDGVEITARSGGRIAPERAEEELPKLVDILRKRDLDVTIMTTEVNQADNATNAKLLKTAAALGIKRYRLGWFKYDDNRPIPAQLADFRSQLLDLAALNRELGIIGLWQNHCGDQYVGATIWDLHQLLQGVPTSEIASAFDIRHATVEAGHSWPRLYQLIKPHIGALYMKDFVWIENRDEHVPFGEGRVNPEFFEALRRDQLNVPVSIHVEYLSRGSAQENLQAIGRDFKRVQELLQTSSSKS